MVNGGAAPLGLPHHTKAELGEMARVAAEIGHGTYYCKRRVRVPTTGGYEFLQKEGTSSYKRRVRVTTKGGYELQQKEGTSFYKRRVRVPTKGGYELLLRRRV